MKQTIINITQTKGNKYGSTNKRRTLEVRSASLHPWGHKNKELRHSLSKNDEETKETSMNITKNIYQTHIIQRSNIMKSSLSKTFVGRSLYALLTIALIATMAMGQHLVIGTGSTYGGAGTYVIKGNITNTGVAAVTPIGGTVTLNGAAAQSIGGGTGAINFSTLNVTPSVVATTTMNVASTVSTAVNIGTAVTAATLAVGANSLTITGTSALVNGSSALTTLAGSTVTYNSGVAGQVVLGGFAYNGALTLSGGATKTLNAATATSVGTVFDASAAGLLTISGGGLTLGTTGTFAAVTNSSTIKNGSGLASFVGAVTNNAGGIIDGTHAVGAVTFGSTVANSGGTITGGAGLATFSGLLTQTATGILTSGVGGLTLTAGLTNTAGNITLASGQSMSISGGSGFAYTAGTLSFDPASTVIYGGSATTIVPSTYGNLTLNTDTKTFPAGITSVATSLDANSNVIITGTLAMSTATANATIGGDFTNNGTFTAASGAGLVTFDGVAQAIGGSATTFKNLTLNGSGAKTTANANINISSGGNLVVTQPLTMSGSNVLTMKNGANAPSFTSVTSEITGSMTWEAYLAQPYTFNNSLTIVTFSAADAARTFGLKVQPLTSPSSYIAANTVRREINASYASWTLGTANMQLAYQNGEADVTLVQGRLKEFHGLVTSADKLSGTITRLASIAGSLGWVKHTLLPIGGGFTSGDEIQLDNRFSSFKSIAATAWDISTTWDLTDPSTPLSTDDVEIAGGWAVTIPTGVSASALSVLIDAGAAGGLTLAGTATLTVGSGGLTNNNIAPGAGLVVVSGTSVTINSGSLTNNGKITNDGTITVQ
jgi:fibronectin-binding autotransporter adhesin